MLYFSYRQIIAAYPVNGGSFTVAKENLGTLPSLFAAAALMVDYVLTVAVGISAGVAALVSAVPRLYPYTLPICLGILTLITLLNLRGTREAGVAFAAPTYLFIASMFTVLGIGIVKSLLTGGHPHPVAVAAGASRQHSRLRNLDPAPILRQRLHRDDRCRGRKQWRHRV